MNNQQNDEDPDEAAARRLQEEIWMEEDQEEEGDDGHDNRLDLVRRLLRGARGAANNAPAADNNNDDNDDDEEDEDDNDNDEEDEDEDEEEDEDPAEDDEENEDDREAIDGGVAGEVFDEQRQKITRALKCPLVLYFECDEDLSDIAPNNPLLLRGATVYVGLDKGSKLSVVFQHYCDFVNSKSPSTKPGSRVYIKPTDLEFMHCTTLDAQHTVEASAMMKNDRIRVVRERSKDRSAKAEMIRLQRESDRKYFKELRSLLPNPSPEGMGSDVILECQGKVKDERGFSQNVLATTVRANSVLIAKRCKWLGQKISTAREDMRRRAEMTIPSDEVKSESKEAERSSSQSDDEEYDIVPSNPLPAVDNNNNNAIAADRVLAAEIEDDEEDDEVDAGKSTTNEQASTSHLRDVASSNSVWISLQHSPQAVKLLLEYCYTNRVQALGQDAFLKASKFPNPKDVGALAAKESGPVPPFRKHEWPDGGAPTVSLHLALAGIALAEEAHMPRFSLMCEVAASKLVDYSNVIDVLAACQTQQQQTGNRLPLLRKAAMLDCVFGKRYFENPIFKNNMIARKDLVIPSVLDGSIEVFPTNLDSKEVLKKKEKMQKEKKQIFDMLDESDRNKRLFERIKQRKQGTVARRMEVAFGQDMPKIASPNETSRARVPPPLNDRRGTKRKGRTSSGSNTSKRKRSQSRKS
mmetsp:Transcript_8738/g.13095  ORF Transcript_8738/g.13095 Transcript_8738/m.13095 type:complete len:693 (+) Transcript_8738:141-2219(+)|eukprot:scaffold27004_cov155-Skeletonema_dohrnii-CCMP3373.AAC.1